MLILSLWITVPQCVVGQRLGFVTSTPRIDSFPNIRLKMTATYNGSLPQPGITPSDLRIKEDNTPVTNFQLQDCDESGQAAIVFCVDVSTSVNASAGDTWYPYRAYFQAFDNFISTIPAASRFALVAFTDVALYYPGIGYPGGFYSGKSKADSAAFENALYAQPFIGYTDIGNAMDVSVNLLKNQPYQQKAIVLVTDDGLLNVPYYDSLINALGMTLYVLEIGKGSPVINSLVSHGTGGVFLTATDSAQFSPQMLQLSEYVFGEHCVIRYPSTNPCPWLKMHDISLSLDYKGLSRSVTEQYVLGRNRFDVDPPLITEIVPRYTSRNVVGTENFPCTRGIKNFSDSLLQNFIKLSQVRKFPNLVSDSLIVGDTLQPARAVYVASDSANNHAIKEIFYVPKPDTLPPLIAVSQSFSGKYQMFLTEDRPWDRGLKSVSLQAGAINFVLDSFRISSRRFATAWLHSPLPTAQAFGCLESSDSVGNIANFCITRDSAAGDTMSPVITQYPTAVPRLALTGLVTEEQYKDIGIKNIIIFPDPNIGPAKFTFLTNRRALFSVPILDSLQPIATPISAADSVGNAMVDTLRYTPLPDNSAPVCWVNLPDDKSAIFMATEVSPWDRGIASVQVLGSAKNLTIGPVTFTDRFHAYQQFDVIDPFFAASAVVQVTDSVGNHCENTISIDPLLKPLIQFPATTLLDFGTVYAPADLTQQVQILNPNESPVIVTKVIQSGDLVFSSDLKAPIIFQPSEKKTFNVRFQPTLLGDWKGTFVLANDTMSLTSVTAVGRSIGEIKITIDTVRLARTQIPGNFNIAISATPAPINLDSISFTLSYDADMVDIQLQNITDCSTSGSPLCNYGMNISPVAFGKLKFDLFRNNSALNTLEFSTSNFAVPFTCFVAQHDSTILSLEDIFASQYSTASYSPGLVSVGSICGDETLRAQLNNNLNAWLESITPNPAGATVSVNIWAKDKGTGYISIVDKLGQTKTRHAVSFAKGLNSESINISALPSGSYQLIFSSQGIPFSSQILQILH
ncbi:MAG: VWA domain-containing protein [Ignavibacteriota bacterium]